MAKLDINIKSSALLVMDCQINILNFLAPSDKNRVLSNLANVLKAARKSRMLIIYVVIAYRKGYPEVSVNNIHSSQSKNSGRLQAGAADTEICPEIIPLPEEIIVTKKRISAFTGSDLEVVLRSNKIDYLVLTGVSTLGVVESTARFAVDMDYRLYILADCCADRVPEANDITMTWVLPRISTVCTSGDFISAIS
ncbi:cysteine hydrolase family protein [Chloroflexota bacterium]